jgi:N-methylhydantoinase B
MSFFDSVEVDELRHPILVTERRLVPDREGAGTYRGAPASKVSFAAHGARLEALYQSDGTVYPALGVRGGGAGGAAENYVTRRDGSHEAADGWATLVLEEGDAVTGISPGGGGYGPPMARDPTRVAHDVAEGVVSRERAREIYGVVLDENGAIDPHKTGDLRSEVDRA